MKLFTAYMCFRFGLCKNNGKPTSIKLSIGKTVAKRDLFVQRISMSTITCNEYFSEEYECNIANMNDILCCYATYAFFASALLLWMAGLGLVVNLMQLFVCV